MQLFTLKKTLLVVNMFVLPIISETELVQQALIGSVLAPNKHARQMEDWKVTLEFEFDDNDFPCIQASSGADITRDFPIAQAE